MEERELLLQILHELQEVNRKLDDLTGKGLYDLTDLYRLLDNIDANTSD